MKKEVRIFFTALMFYTRIPCPRWVDHSEEYLNKATRYFPLVGWIVGGFSAIIFTCSSYIFTKEISLVLSMATGILLTGAFHEDGFADVCDGFGGGWTKEKILAIMKDSRIGAYGTIGVCMILLLKFFLLVSVDSGLVPFVLVASHALSRWSATVIIVMHTYARENNEDGKSKPVAKGISTINFLIASIFGFLPLALFHTYFAALIVIPVYAFSYLLGKYFHKWIGGYTGDCLGATQQICEVVFYMSFLALWKFI